MWNLNFNDLTQQKHLRGQSWGAWLQKSLKINHFIACSLAHAFVFMRFACTGLRRGAKQAAGIKSGKRRMWLNWGDWNVMLDNKLFSFIHSFSVHGHACFFQGWWESWGGGGKYGNCRGVGGCIIFNSHHQHQSLARLSFWHTLSS